MDLVFAVGVAFPLVMMVFVLIYSEIERGKCYRRCDRINEKRKTSPIPHERLMLCVCR